MASKMIDLDMRPTSFAVVLVDLIKVAQPRQSNLRSY